MNVVPRVSRRTLLLSTVTAVTVLAAVFIAARRTEPHPSSARMRTAAEHTVRCFEAVQVEKERRGVTYDEDAAHRRHPLLGTELSFLTTTLGSFEAKVASTNPEFAALAVRLLGEAGVDSGDAVGVTLSGSFPALGISLLCAVEQIGARPVIISSLGASTFGANEEAMTWADMEGTLNRNNLLHVRSRLMTPGAEADTGGGLPEEGMEAIWKAVRRTGSVLIVPPDLPAAIALRESLFLREKISAYVNVGGSQAVLGTCPHAPSYENGILTPAAGCRDEGRGVIAAMLDRGVPVIHFLNIRDLARRYDIDEDGSNERPPSRLYEQQTVDPVWPLAGALLIAAPLLWDRLRARKDPHSPHLPTDKRMGTFSI